MRPGQWTQWTVDTTTHCICICTDWPPPTSQFTLSVLTTMKIHAVLLLPYVLALAQSVSIICNRTKYAWEPRCTPWILISHHFDWTLGCNHTTCFGYMASLSSKGFAIYQNQATWFRFSPFPKWHIVSTSKCEKSWNLGNVRRPKNTSGAYYQTTIIITHQPQIKRKEKFFMQRSR